MTLESSNYAIEITIDQTFTLDSTDNKPYDCILNPTRMTRSDHYKTVAISVDDGIIKRCIAVIGSIYGSDEDVGLCSNEDLIVLMNTTLLVIDCRSLALKLCISISDYGIYYSIHRYCGGYIIYGELNIVKLSQQYEVEWTYAGADIFVTNDGSVPFTIEAEFILLTDWAGDQYKLNKYGERIK